LPGRKGVLEKFHRIYGAARAPISGGLDFRADFARLDRWRVAIDGKPEFGYGSVR
jgi:hypothetical protein